VSLVIINDDDDCNALVFLIVGSYFGGIVSALVLLVGERRTCGL